MYITMIILKLRMKHAGIDGYQIDQAELELMRRNFEKLRKEG